MIFLKLMLTDSMALADAFVWLAVRLRRGYKEKAVAALSGCAEAAIKFIVKIILLAQKSQAHPAG